MNKIRDLDIFQILNMDTGTGTNVTNEKYWKIA